MNLTIAELKRRYPLIYYQHRSGDFYQLSLINNKYYLYDVTRDKPCGWRESTDYILHSSNRIVIDYLEPTTTLTSTSCPVTDDLITKDQTILNSNPCTCDFYTIILPKGCQCGGK